jgi:hypothetical protein
MYNSNFQYNPYNSYNPYNPAGNATGINSPYQSQNRQEIPKVNGMGGANAFPLSANSSALLLDINEPIVYLKQADGGGFCSVTPYSIARIEQNQNLILDTSDLEKRIKRLEELYESYTVNVTELKQPKSSQSDTKH